MPHKPKLKRVPGVSELPDLELRNPEKQKARSPPIHTDPDATMASEPTPSSLAMLASSQVQASSSALSAKKAWLWIEKWTTDDGILSFPLAMRRKQGGTPDVSASSHGLQPPKTRYFCATTILSSSMPSTVSVTGGIVAAVTHGAEIVGQAQMPTKFSRPSSE
ncbi:hypothetical protein BU15DRAFT_79687 [Melanogaster broomeanus]|nr:hypothetical protein BU15DRAFT_79687 [Melanogaster broomeanus]